MHNFIASLCLIFSVYVFDSVAAPTPVSFTIRSSSFTRLQADNITAVFASPSPQNIRSSSPHPLEPRDTSDDLQPIPNAFFPKYGIVLLILFIIVCALSSALVIITVYSGAARSWICRSSGRLYAWVTSDRCEVKEVQRDHHSSHHDEGTKKKHGFPFNTSSDNSDHSSPYNIPSELTDKTKANTSEETVTSTPAVPFSVESVHFPFSSDSKKPSSRDTTHSPHDTLHLRPLSPLYSPLFDHLHTLLSTSKRMFQSLTADLTSRSSTPHPPSPNITVTVDTCRLRPAQSDVSVSSPPTRTDSDGPNVTEVMECDLGCQDIASIPPSVVTLTMLTQQSPLPHSATHTSPSINSRSGFYSLPGDPQLSASTTFHSFIDLDILATLTDTHSEMVQASDPSEDADPMISLLSPRYMHGLQLETIHEESDGHLTSLASASSASVARDDTPFKVFSTSNTKKSHSTLSYSSMHSPTSGHRIENSEKSQQSDPTSLTENMPSLLAELSHGTFTPPRFFPAARPPPPPSEPSSAPTPQVTSALRSPEKQDKRRSVAWLHPVIDWAVDHPQGGSVDDLEDIPDMESDAECAAALHSAHAMAAVMDSLAAIGLDPTDMGLVTEEAISSRLSNSSFHATSPSLPFLDPETFRSKLRARAGAADTDAIEEEEVENEIGVLSGYTTPQRPHQLEVSSRSRYETVRENQHNRILYQDQQQGRSIKTALISFLSPSSSYPNTNTQPDGELSDNLQTPPQASETERISRRDSGREKFQIRNAYMNAESRTGTGRALSPTSRSAGRPLRAVQPDRVFPSPSSLAGLSPLEVAKKFSAPSVSSAGSTPSPSGNRTASSPHRSTPMSPLPKRNIKGISNSPSFDCTASTLASSAHRDPVSPSPRSRTPISSRQRWQQGEDSGLGSTKSTPMLSLSHDAIFLPQFSSSPISPTQRPKPAVVSALARSAPILIERTNSMDFDSV